MDMACGSQRPEVLTAHGVVSPAANISSSRRRVECVVRLFCAAACLAAVAAVVLQLSGQDVAARRDVLLAGKLSDNYYVDARVEQHREERLQELRELRREAAEKQVRKAALQAQETRQVENENSMASRQLDRYNAIYTAATPEEAEVEAQTPRANLQEDTSMDDKLDQYDSPTLAVARAWGRAGLAAYNDGAQSAVAPAQGLSTSSQSVETLVTAAAHDLQGLEDRLDGSSALRTQRGSGELKDILSSSMLQLKGLANRVGVQISAPAPSLAVTANEEQTPHATEQPDTERRDNVITATRPHAAEVPPLPAGDHPYPSMQSMVAKYKAWMQAKKEMERTGTDPSESANGPRVQGLSSVALSKLKKPAVVGPCEQINQIHAEDTAARENACAGSKACHYDFGYQLCLEKK
jgi:hypothetical protein